MQPRQMFPMQVGMRPGPFGGNGPMRQPGQPMFMGGNPMMGQGPSGFPGRNPMMRPTAGPMGGMMGGRQPGMGGGGFLSRLLGRGNPMRGAGNVMGMQGAGRAAGGGLLQSLSNPSGLAGILNNTQQVLKTAQTITPMIQQYGPLVKNLPALWKLYRGLKNAPDAEEKTNDDNQMASTESQEESSRRSSRSPRNSKDKGTEKNSPQKTSQPTREARKPKGTSVPKMYI
ncbi:VrrA/YqfQ family protein [Neobacillus sp. Marseille-QA0830]